MSCEFNKRNGRENNGNGKLHIPLEKGRKIIVPEKQTEKNRRRSSHKPQPQESKKKPK